jgi:hypothetical protein
MGLVRQGRLVVVLLMLLMASVEAKMLPMVMLMLLLLLLRLLLFWLMLLLRWLPPLLLLRVDLTQRLLFQTLQRGQTHRQQSGGCAEQRLQTCWWHRLLCGRELTRLLMRG